MLMCLSALCAPNVCRSVCTLTFLRIPAFLTYLATIALTDETFKDVPFLARNSVSSSRMISVAR
jgi:hypothetical protein